MTAIGLFARYGIIAALAAALSGCLILVASSSHTQVGNTDFYTVTGSATFTPCTPTAVPGGTSVSCSLTVQGLPPWTIMATLVGITPAEVPPLWDPLIVQVPLTAGNFSGTITGPGGGSLTATVVTGTIYADATTPIVPDPGTQLVLIDFTPGTPITTGTTYQFTLNFQTTGATGGPLPVKFIFAGKVTVQSPAAESGRTKATTTYYPPLLPCTAQFANIPAIMLPAAGSPAPVNITPLFTQQGCAGTSYSFAATPPPTTAVAVEFYNQSLDHYFITDRAPEIAILDAGVTIKGWARTGQSWNIYTAAQANTSPVCRFYIPPAFGDSHFYGRGTVECDATGANNPSFVNEDPAFFHVVLPVAGVCPAGLRNVYRVFSNRPDANHRYMVDPALRDLMVTRGWLAEGDGPNLVVMCVPA